MGCYLLPSPAPAGPMKRLRYKSLMTQLIYFKHLKHPPPSANLLTAGCSQHVGAGAAGGLVLLFEIWRNSPGIRTLPVQGQSKTTIKLDIFTVCMYCSGRKIACDARIIWHRNLK